MDKADRDYRAAEENFRKPSTTADSAAVEKKRRAILRQHAALLQKEGKTEAAHQIAGRGGEIANERYSS